MIILGLNAFHGDSSAALVRDGKLVAAAEEERFRRVKHWAGFPSQAIAYCLREAGLRLADVDHVAVNQDSRANLLRKLAILAAQPPDIGLVLDRLRNRQPAAGRFPSSSPRHFPATAFAAQSTTSSIISRIFPRPFTSRRSRKRSSSRSMASAISPVPPGASAGRATSISRAACIFRIRSASSIRRSRNISAFRITATNTR